VKEVKF